MSQVITKNKKIIVLLLIFFFAVGLRLWNLNKVGRTTDEVAQTIDGYDYLQILKKGDFGNKYLYDHPYHPPLTKYIYGMAMYRDIADLHPTKQPFFLLGEPVFNYDWTTARVVSVIFSSLTVILVLLIGWEFFSAFVGIVASIILAMFPFFVGLSQLASIESILIFFFTASFFAFLKLLDNNSTKNIILTGILLGLAMETKYTNALLIPLFFCVYLLWYFYVGKKKQISFLNLKLLILFPIALLVFFFLWPFPWFHLPEVLQQNYQLRIKNAGLPVPEFFFGKLVLVPKEYYIVYFLLTTPLVILLFFFNGLKYIYDSRFNKKSLPKTKWLFYALVLWFAIPFIQSLYNFRQHGVRYIIEIYAPLALIAAVGFDNVISRATKKTVYRLLLFLPLVIYLFITLWTITPYYLDYFNGLVGGAKGVYEKRLFQMGWWGEGLREAGFFLARTAPNGSTVGLAVEPVASVPPLPNIKTSIYKASVKYDYVMVSYYAVVREGFDDTNVRKNYVSVYNVKADGAVLVTVYKHK